MTSITCARLCAGRVHYAWIVLGVVFSATLACVGVRAAPGVMILPLQRAFGWDVAYHVGPITFSVDGMNVKNTWHKGETQTYNVVSGGMMAEW